jgi:flavin-dependent dehydrogenase
MADRAWDFDAVVIGGGPGGSSAATALARRGHRVLLLEREVFPRFHIGESQLPWSDEVFRALGVQDVVAQAGFVEKWGASFTSADGAFDQYADFAQAVETPRPQTVQVRRADFDHLLLKHSARSGVDVREGCRALDAQFDQGGVSVTLGVLARRFGRRAMDPVLRNVAVHAQYEGIPRPEGRRAGDIRMVTRPDRGWFWFIPISPTVISVGAVIPKAVHDVKARATGEETLDLYLAETPMAAALVRGARRVTPARYDADYSYLAAEHAGDRWVLVGDAGAFLDPIFSTGVLLAMQSGLEAAEVIHQGLGARDLSRRRFASYEARLRKRYHHFRRFAVGFYDPAFRDLWFQRTTRFGLYPAVLSVLAGNWRPSLATRLRIRLFFILVALQRRFGIVPPAPEASARAAVLAAAEGSR